MIFSNRISKFAKGDKISCYAKGSTLYVFLHKKGVSKLIITFDGNNISVERSKAVLPYSSVLKVDDEHTITVIAKNIGIVSDE